MEMRMYKGRDLTGTCGIPFEGERVYVGVECLPKGAIEDYDIP